MDPVIIKRSKKLSWLLRHGAAEAGVPMDAAGWANVSDVLRAVRMTREQLEEVVETNEKRRLELDGDRVRAVQGHSIDNAAVDLDALEESWVEWKGHGSIFHGTYRGALRGIGEKGLLPFARTHVHLISDRESVAGKRANVDVLLVIDPSRVRSGGVRLYEAPNGVVLARNIPRAAIVDLEPITKKARHHERELRATLGLRD
jgi:putative RNA 2'-phosphotransferase